MEWKKERREGDREMITVKRGWGLWCGSWEKMRAKWNEMVGDFNRGKKKREGSGGWYKEEINGGKEMVDDFKEKNRKGELNKGKEIIDDFKQR